MLKRFVRLNAFLSLLVVALLQSSAKASVWGEGTLLAPSPDMVMPGEVSISLSGFSGDSLSGRVSYSPRAGLEVGVSNPPSASSPTDLRFDAKVRLLGESRLTPQLSAGFRHDGIFVSMSKHLSSAGIDIYGGIGTDDLSRGYLGISKVVRVWNPELKAEAKTLTLSDAGANLNLPEESGGGITFKVLGESLGGVVSIGATLGLGTHLFVDTALQGLQKPVIGVRFREVF